MTSLSKTLETVFRKCNKKKNTLQTHYFDPDAHSPFGFHRPSFVFLLLKMILISTLDMDVVSFVFFSAITRLVCCFHARLGLTAGCSSSGSQRALGKQGDAGKRTPDVCAVFRFSFFFFFFLVFFCGVRGGIRFFGQNFKPLNRGQLAAALPRVTLYFI